jgi:hypothetical protein
MKLRTVFIIMLMCIASFGFAQSEEEEELYQNFWANGKEVGINVTNLAARFVPFNLATRNDDATQFIALKTKWYGETRAFIINFGINVKSENDEFNNKLYLGIGYEKRRNISENWKYVTGWELAATNFGKNAERFDSSPYLTISKAFGIEYHFAQNFYLSTEARLIVGRADDFKFLLSYPTSIYFNMLLE